MHSFLLLGLIIHFFSPYFFQQHQQFIFHPVECFFTNFFAKPPGYAGENYKGYAAVFEKGNRAASINQDGFPLGSFQRYQLLSAGHFAGLIEGSMRKRIT